MTWTQLSDDWMDHPKILMVSELAAFLWVKSITYCNKHLTNGFVPRAVLSKLTGAKAAEKLAGELVGAIPPGYCAGLWEPCDGGWMIHHFLEHGNPSREQVTERRRAAAERQSRCRARHTEDRHGARESHDESRDMSQRDVTRESRGDSHSESRSDLAGARPGGDRDLDQGSGSGSGSAPEGGRGGHKSRAAPKKPETPLPADWLPIQSHYEKGAKLGMSRESVDQEAERFKVKAELKQYRYSDWNLAFHSWLISPLQEQNRSVSRQGAGQRQLPLRQPGIAPLNTAKLEDIE